MTWRKLLVFSIAIAGWACARAAEHQASAPGTLLSAPGALLSAKTVPLASVLAAHGPAAAAGSGSARVQTCLYRAANGSRAADVRRFWYRAAPAWVASLGASDHLHDLVEGVTSDCPATLSEADALQDSSDIRLAGNQALIASPDAPPPAKPQPAVAGPGTQAQPGPAVQAQPGQGLLAFSASGLNYEHEVTSIYIGDFLNARLKADSPELGILLGRYIDVFSRSCANDLPPNKVEIMETYCETERVPVNRYGMQSGMSTCSSYATRGTGRYADPALQAASTRLAAQTSAAMLGNLWGSLKDPSSNPMASSLQLTDAVASVGNDLSALLQRNGCATPSTRHFQHNLLAFAYGVPGESIRLPPGSALLRASVSNTANLTREMDGARLLDDLITEQSRTWMMNRYIPRSAAESRDRRDGTGRVSELSGTYAFNTLGKEAAGTVRVDFMDGLPHCIFFSDAPGTCRAASRRIITAYEQGTYAK